MGTPKAGHGDSDVLSAESKRKIRGSAESGHEQESFAVPSRIWEDAAAMQENLVWLLSRGDGWMRWTSDLDGKVLYLKYKFTSMRHPNHYVFVSGPIYEVATLVATLLRKCEKVDAGSLQPTQDKPYNHM